MRAGIARVIIAGLAACGHLPARAASLAGGEAPDIPWLRIVLSLLFCLALAAAAIHVLRLYQRRGGSGPKVRGSAGGTLLARLREGSLGQEPQVVVIEARRLGPASQLCLVEFDGRQILLGVAQGSVNVLAERDAPDAPDLQGDLP